MLGNGAVQEELLLLQFPETLVGLLLFEKLDDNEAVIIYGARHMIRILGYSTGMKYNNVIPDNQRGGRRFGNSEIIAVDALQFPSQNSDEELRKINLDRELLKAYTGFFEPETSEPLPIGGGKWGCGVFNVLIGYCCWCVSIVKNKFLGQCHSESSCSSYSRLAESKKYCTSHNG